MNMRHRQVQRLFTQNAQQLSNMADVYMLMYVDVHECDNCHAFVREYPLIARVSMVKSLQYN